MILYLNACVRERSRTKRLAEYLLSRLGEPVRERKLWELDFPCADEDFLKQRDALLAKGERSAPLFDLAREFAEADTIVVAAPYWDLSFPAVLKVYLEWASTLNVTFHYNDQGKSEGLCKADKLLYITTGGGPVYNRNHGYEYIKALSGMLGIHHAHCVAGEFLDVVDGPCQENMRKAEETLTQLAKDW
jgi:FMN-dependent NADH-azoreductase